MRPVVMHGTTAPAGPQPSSVPPYLPLSEAVRLLVEPGLHLHFASTPSRSNAAIRAVARAFRGKDPGFTLSTSGFHSTAHLLGVLGLGRRYLACFFGDNYPGPRPNPLYARLAARGASIEHWSLLTYVTALRAGALGQEWGVTRSLGGTTLGAELAAAGQFMEIPDPANPGTSIGLVRALRPDVTFVHAAVADEHGNVCLSAPRGEGLWSALGAKAGVVVTVERFVHGDLARLHPDLVLLPRHRIRAICVEPFGAHPQPHYAIPALDTRIYRDDFDHYGRWAELAAEPPSARREREIDALIGHPDEPPDDGADSYRGRVGPLRLAMLSSTVKLTPDPPPPAPVQALPARRGDSAIDRLVIAAARHIAARARAAGHRTLLAGIGQGFLASRLARQTLAAAGHEVAVLVETGLYDLDCGPGTSPFLLAWDNVARARGLSDIDTVLGALACGAGADCLGVLGAAQVDVHGNLNSTRAGGQELVGSGGASDVAAAAAEVIVVMRSGPGRLVDAVDYVTSPGLRVSAVVTDEAVLVRAGAGAPWRVAVLLATPGQRAADALAALQRSCPWPLEPVGALEPLLAEPPTDAELELLQLLDPDGGAGRPRRDAAAPSRSPSPSSTHPPVAATEKERVHARAK